MQAKHDEKHSEKWYLDVLVHSETELDNLQDISSVVSENNGNMSWPDEGSHNYAFEGEEKGDGAKKGYPLRPGSGIPPHHQHHHHSQSLSSHEKKKKKSSVSFNIDVTEGRTSSKIENSVTPMPEPQTDVPVFSVSASKKPPLRHDSTFSFTSQTSDIDQTRDDIQKRPKRRRSSRDRKKRRHSSKAHMHLDENAKLFSIKDSTTTSDDLSSTPQRYAAARTFFDDPGNHKQLHKRSSVIITHDDDKQSTGVKDALQDPSTDQGFSNLRRNSASSVQTIGRSGDELGDSSFSVKTQTLQRHRSQAHSFMMKKGHKNQRMNQRSLAKFVSSQIKQKECEMYVKNNKDASDKCCCGRLRTYHISHGIDVEKDKDLSPKDWHSTEFPCDSFGEIHFRGFGGSTNNSPYVRVSSDTNACTLWELMIDYWKLPLPRLLISVTGGAQRFEMKDRMRSLLKQGLVGAAVSTGAWLVTGGTAAGVMEFVGEAVRDHMTVYGSNSDQQCVALGVATWGIVANQIALDGEGEDGLFPATYAIEDVLRDPVKGFSALDMNHTHFILVDDGTVGNYGREIVFRSKLEKYISAIGTMGVSENQVISIPAVLVVVEGGIGTMETVVQSLNRKTPVVLVKGSGRVADFIALGYEMTRHPTSDDITLFPPSFDDIMIEEANRIFSFKDAVREESCRKAVKKLRDCLKGRSLVNVFDLEKSNTVKDIDRAILRALLRANKGDNNSQLALALAWNRCDIARQQIFTPENASRWKSKDLYNAMFTALVQDRADFVQLFLDNGVDLQKFLTVETLWNLYCNCLSVDSDGEAAILRHMVTVIRQGWGAYLTCRALEDWSQLGKHNILLLIGRVIARLMRNEAFQYYSDPDKYCMDPDEHITSEWKGDIKTLQPLITRLTSSEVADGHPNSGDEEEEPHDAEDRPHLWTSKRLKQRLRLEEKPDFQHPEFDLFLFAILFNRRQMAQVFLKQGQDQIGTALMGCALLQSLSNKADLDEEVTISMDLTNHAQLLEHFSLGVLSECYSRSKIDAHKLLVRPIPHIGYTTLLTLAEQQGLMDFVEHSACQTKLSQIWKGRIFTHTSETKIFLTLLCPPMVLFMKFVEANWRGNDEEEEKEEEEEFVPPYESMNTDKSHLSTNSTLKFVPSRARRKDPTRRTKYSEVRMLGCGGDDAINVFRAFHKFYRAPVTKFYANILAYLVLLGLFSLFLLTNLHSVKEPDSPSAIELVVWVWFGTMIIEEVRQVIIRDQRSLTYKVRNWWTNTWNRFDVLMYTGVIISILMRYTLHEHDFVHVRIVYSITLAMSFLRLMQYFYASRNMGPKVIMIRRMLTDLMFFFLILLVFVLSFGVAYHINMFPNAPLDWSILFNVLYYPYFQIYGELFLEDLKGEDVDGCTRNETIWQNDPMERCAEKNAVVPIFLAFYMILTNILLVNLLIAMFSYTFQTVQDNSTKVWRFYRISLVFEYFDRPSFVPPIIILNHIWRSVRYILFKHTSFNVSKRHNLFRTRMSDDDIRRLTLFEKIATEAFLTNSSMREREKLDTRVASTAERVEIVMGELQRIKEAVQLYETSAKTSDNSHTQVTPLTATPRTQAETEKNAWETPRDVPKTVEQQIEALKKQASQNAQQLEKVSSLLETLLQQQTSSHPPPMHQAPLMKPADISDPE